MDLLHEALDFDCRAGGDFFLHRGQLFPALQIAEIDFDKTARNQAPTDQKHGDKEVIADQPPAPPPKNPGSAKILDFGFYPLEHLFYIFCFIAPTNSKERKNGCTLRSLGSSVVYPIVLASFASHLFSFDYLLRSRQHVGWDRQAQLLGGLEINREFNILDRLDLEIFGMSPAQNFLDVLGGKPPDLIVVLAVARECAVGDHTLLVEHGC